MPRLSALTHLSVRRLGTRLALGFGLMCLLLLGIGALAIGQSRVMQAQFAAALDGRVPALVRLQALDREVQSVNLAARDALLAADEAAATAALARIEAGRQKIGSEIEALQKSVEGSADPFAPVVEELGTQSSGALVMLLKFSRQLKAGQADGAKTQLASALTPRMNSFAALIAKAQGLQLGQLDGARQKSEEAARWGQGATAATVAVAMLVAALLAWRITRGITQPIQAIVTLAERIAAGDLGHPMQAPTRQDELGQLQTAMLDMRHQLCELVAGIRQSADSIANASQEIAGGNHHLSRRTEEAAASLQRTASAMDAVTRSVGDSAASAQSAGTMVASASQAAHRGGTVVLQVIDRMGEITTASKRIADITGVIDSIAFQTNILALNAAVEAARAGEHGRGFAVVASEVRALAQRSATASREIKGLIGDSVDKVEAGSKLAEGAGSAMREIVADVERVSSVVGDICSRASSQSSGLGEVNAAVRQIDDVTQQNAALVEQSTAAAESLREQAQGLQELVNRFRLEVA
ncbi:HAMP domain-containing protein [Aquincola sp. S2]|uniref:HAMP domain-containing protein n=1 Tax=Pseudaquabacterium terrae TaxID=2732868 RepID=A0ABX2EQ32_9BURK|nr:methyl-accepting chemotaxis protein [Aquabacterium terrae]NRF70679.1 HAMP domain-containing protein [Aquabacterium terrae]